MSKLYRVVNDDIGLQADFLPFIHGVKSFESLRSRAQKMDFGGNLLLVASLPDIIASKRAAGRPRDAAALEVIEKTWSEKTKRQS